MPLLSSSSGVLLLGLVVAANLLGAGWLPAARAATTANAELEKLIAKLPDPAKWKESPLQNALDPATHDPDLKRVGEAVKAKNFADALRLMRPLAARYPEHPAIQFNYGQLALTQKAYPAAEKAFRAVAADRRTVAPGWFYLGLTQYAQNHPTEAGASMRRCLATHPPDIIAACVWTVIASRQSEVGHHPAAIEAAQLSTRLAPKSGFMWTIRAFCEANGKQYAASIVDFRRAISLDHRMALAYEGLGAVYLQTNRPGDAIAPLKVAFSLAPGNAAAALQLGFCYLRAGQPADGAAMCRKAVGAQPKFSKGWDVLGLCYSQLGRKRDAVEAFQQAIKTGPENTAARAHLEQARRADGVRA